MAATMALIIAVHREAPLVATASSSSGGLTSKVMVIELRGGMTSSSQRSVCSNTLMVSRMWPEPCLAGRRMIVGADALTAY